MKSRRDTTRSDVCTARPATNSSAARAANRTCCSVPSRMTSDSAASTASRMRRERSVLGHSFSSRSRLISGAAAVRRSSRKCEGSTARFPVKDPPSVLYAAIKILRRSFTWRFSRSRRCCTACVTSNRMPTAIKVMTARPTAVESNACHELKSRPRNRRLPSFDLSDQLKIRILSSQLIPIVQTRALHAHDQSQPGYFI